MLEGRNIRAAGPLQTLLTECGHAGILLFATGHSSHELVFVADLLDVLVLLCDHFALPFRMVQLQCEVLDLLVEVVDLSLQHLLVALFLALCGLLLDLLQLLGGVARMN